MRQTVARPGAAVMFGAARGRGWLRRGLRIGWAAGLAVTACTSAAGHPAAARPAAATPTAPFVYAADTGRNEISQFGSSPGGSGGLRPLTPKTVASGPGPYDVAVSPQGTSVYAVDVSPSGAAGEVSQYTISPATGKLTPKSPKTVPTAAGPSGIIALAPDGKNAYVTSGNDSVLAQFAISPATGKITPLSPATVTLPSGSLGLAITPATAKP